MNEAEDVGFNHHCLGSLLASPRVAWRGVAWRTNSPLHVPPLFTPLATSCDEQVALELSRIKAAEQVARLRADRAEGDKVRQHL